MIFSSQELRLKYPCPIQFASSNGLDVRTETFHGVRHGICDVPRHLVLSRFSMGATGSLLPLQFNLLLYPIDWFALILVIPYEEHKA